MPRAPRLLGPLGLVAAAAVLALVFALYLDPHFIVDVATRLWACF